MTSPRAIASSSLPASTGPGTTPLSRTLAEHPSISGLTGTWGQGGRGSAPSAGVPEGEAARRAGSFASIPGLT